jgi:rRNA-processing protein FCF1
MEVDLSPEKATNIILDSSFLFSPSQFRIHIFDELQEVLNRKLEPIILSSTYSELQTLAERGSPKTRLQAKLALKLAGKCRLIKVRKHGQENPDDIIVRVASNMKFYVATNDSTLRKRLRSIGVTVIYMRQKSHLAVEGNA